MIDPDNGTYCTENGFIVVADREFYLSDLEVPMVASFQGKNVDS